MKSTVSNKFEIFISTVLRFSYSGVFNSPAAFKSYKGLSGILSVKVALTPIYTKRVFDVTRI